MSNRNLVRYFGSGNDVLIFGDYILFRTVAQPVLVETWVIILQSSTFMNAYFVRLDSCQLTLTITIYEATTILTITKIVKLKISKITRCPNWQSNPNLIHLSLVCSQIQVE